MNAEKYHQILATNLKHSANATQNWFKDNKVNVLELKARSQSTNFLVTVTPGVYKIEYLPTYDFLANTPVLK